MKSLSFLILFLASAPVWAEVPPPTGPATVHMKIEGMTCAMCAESIKQKLAPLCQNSSIDVKGGSGDCTYEAGKTTPDAIVKAVSDAGYKAVIVP